jgi:hypothetical protein
MTRRPNERRFQRANSGVVFEFISKDFPDATPIVFLLASDASFSGQHREHHPIYREFFMNVMIIMSIVMRGRSNYAYHMY